MKQYLHFIDGKWLAPSTGRFIESFDPANAVAWAEFARGNEADANLAVLSADRAFRNGPWSACTANERAEILDHLADCLESRWEELVESEIQDNGKRIVEVRAQFSALHTWYRYFSKEVRNLQPEAQVNSIPGVNSETHYFPFGVVVAITPWNSPLMILAWKLAPALAAGNTVVVKPSELASASTLEFAKIAHEAGLPNGVLNVVTGYGGEAGEALVRHPLTRKVTFTGSDIGGCKVAEAAASGPVPVNLELGGKSPQIVFEDADLESAVNGIASGIFLSNGQTCVAGSRLIVQKAIKNKLVEKIIRCAESLKIGHPMNPDTQIGPLANESQYHKVMNMIQCAKNEGAVCLTGGQARVPDKCPYGYFVAPTIFDQVSTGMQLWQEEVFGPVLAVIEFGSEDEAVELANNSKYGLAAGIWTTNETRASRLAAKIDAGTVYLNHYRSVAPGAQVGGVKRSGYGRELGANAIKDFLQTRSIWFGKKPMTHPF